MSETFTVAEIAAALGATIEGKGDLRVRGLVHPDMASPDDLVMASSPDFLKRIVPGSARAGLLAQGADWQGACQSFAVFAT